MQRRDFWKICLAAGWGFIIPGWLSPKAEAGLRIGDIPPRMILNDLKGTPFNLPGAFKGKVALIHFWASWCPSCRKEMILLETIHQHYGPKGILPCSIDVGETKEAAQQYLRNVKITYPVLLDPRSSTARQFGVSGIPTSYVLNRETIIRFKILGEPNQEGLDRIIKGLL
ncbi:MAG: TlpA family protein disulfide reductase [Deltaproteobacteria bacterium]|nr:TlpA family protein disulfide reductase [Deltaproteobacteria bacterium]